MAKTTSAQRMRKIRDRRRREVTAVPVEVSEHEINYVIERGYKADPKDRDSVGSAISLFLSDLVFQS